MTATADALAEPWRRPSPSRRGTRRDIWIAIVLAGGTALSVALTRTAGVMDDSPAWLAALWVACIALPLAARRRWPEAVAIVLSLVYGVGAMLDVGDGLFGSICLYLAIYAVGAWSRHRVLARWVRLAIIAGMFIWLFWQLIVQANQATTLPDLSRDGFFSAYAAYGMLQVLINLVYFWAAYYFGDLAWQSAHRSADLGARTRELAAERERTAAQAITLERVRIARELHDVVAHHVSVMGVQAGAARRILDRDPAAASAALTVIEQSARSAVEELHALLGTLRADGAGTDDEASANHGPSTHGVGQLRDLAEESRRGGVPVTVTAFGEAREVPGTISLSIYRIVQEALTNTRKHAGPGALAEVRLRFEPGAVELEVTDDGIGPRRGSGALPAATTGLGQVGMRERVQAGGGQLQLGARPRGGYLVRARFPLLPVEES